MLASRRDPSVFSRFIVELENVTTLVIPGVAPFPYRVVIDILARRFHTTFPHNVLAQCSLFPEHPPVKHISSASLTLTPHSYISHTRSAKTPHEEQTTTIDNHQKPSLSIDNHQSARLACDKSPQACRRLSSVLTVDSCFFNLRWSKRHLSKLQQSPARLL